jgi:hypothetical protein
MAMAAQSSKAGGTSGDDEPPNGPQKGENVGDLHPKTGHPILDVIVEEDTVADLVEASKPSRQGKLTRKITKIFLENPGHHDPSAPGRKYDPSKSVMPANVAELFHNSIEFEGNRYALDAQGNIHQFQATEPNVYHWAGAENAKTASGEVRQTIKIPTGLRARLRRQ